MLRDLKEHIKFYVASKKQLSNAVKKNLPVGERVVFRRTGEEVKGVVTGHGNWWSRPEHVYIDAESGTKHTVYVPDIISSASSSE